MIRILHVVENLGHQAVENWLLRMLAASRDDYTQFHWSFFCVLGEQGSGDERAIRQGAEVVHSPYSLKQKFRFLRFFRNVVKERRIDVLHCHHDVMSAVYLLASIGLPVRRKIVHLHNPDLALPTPNRIKLALLREPMRRLSLQLADRVVGISHHTLRAFTHQDTRKPERDRLVYYGIDTSAFRSGTRDRAVLCSRLCLPLSSKLILFAGRMVSYKNPLFVLEVLENLIKGDPSYIALFVGSGPLTSQLSEIITKRSLEKNTRVLGWRDDLPMLMQNCDIFINPREEGDKQVGKEGLGMVNVEAQAAGLPILMSLGVPEDAIVVPRLIERLPLRAGPLLWAEKISKMLRKRYPSPNECREAVESSPFSLRCGVSSLMTLYSDLS